MKEIFIKLFEQYEQIYRKEEDPVKTFSDSADENEKNIVKVIYILKIFDNEIEEDDKIHDYAAYLYGEDAVNEIKEGNNKNIDEDFKNYDKLEPTEEEKNEKFNEFCKEKNIDPEKYEISKITSPQNEGDDSENKNKGNFKNEKIFEHEENLNKNKYSDDDLLNYNGWQLDFLKKD